jgi:acyl-CoA thioesterase FadM
MKKAAAKKSRMGFLDEDRMTGMGMPWDSDPNKHMTNRRYYQFLGLGRISCMIHSGGWERLLAAGLFPVQGSAAIRFRREIKIFQRFTVTTRIGAWDDRWFFFDHRFLDEKEDLAAAAQVKVTFLGKQGRPPSDEVARIMGYDGPRPPLAEQHKLQEALDNAMSKAHAPA